MEHLLINLRRACILHHSQTHMKTPTKAKETKEQIRSRRGGERQPRGTMPLAGGFGETWPMADWVNSDWFRQCEALAYGSAGK